MVSEMCDSFEEMLWPISPPFNRSSYQRRAGNKLDNKTQVSINTRENDEKIASVWDVRAISLDCSSFG